MYKETKLPKVKVLADYLDAKEGKTYNAIKPMFLKVDNEYLIVSAEGGPDLWRGQLIDIGITHPTLQECSLKELVDELHRRMK